MTSVTLLLVTFLFAPYSISAVEETLWKADFEKAKINHHNTRVCMYVGNEEKCVTRDSAPGDPEEVAKLFNLVHSVVDVDDVTHKGPDQVDVKAFSGEENGGDDDTPGKRKKKLQGSGNVNSLQWKDQPRLSSEKSLWDRIIETWSDRIKEQDAEKERRQKTTTTESPKNTKKESSKKKARNKGHATIAKVEVSINATLVAKIIENGKSDNTNNETVKVTNAHDKNNTVIMVIKDDLDEKGNDTIDHIIENKSKVIKTDKPGKVDKIDRHIKNNTTNEVEKTKDDAENKDNSYEYTFETYSYSDSKENKEKVDEIVTLRNARNKLRSVHKYDTTQRQPIKKKKSLKYKKLNFLVGKKTKLKDVINNYN